MPLQATSGAASYDGFGGGVVAEPNYIESCFSTYLYAGTSASQTITNNIDLSTKGGLVWLKNRTSAVGHKLFSPATGMTYAAAYELETNLTDGFQGPRTNTIRADTTGFSLGTASNFSAYNLTGQNYVSWTFREQPKFFDVVTFTTDGSGGATFSHLLGSTPACMFVKSTGSVGGWYVYHTSLGVSQYLQLNSTAAAATSTNFFTVSSTSVTIAANGALPNSTACVAYLFASNAGGFGLTGTDNVISCGSYTGNGSTTGPVITLGYEPQWVMVKRSDAVSNWTVFDTMRGMSQTNANLLYPNLSDAEGASAQGWVVPTATGFQLASSSTSVNAVSGTYIYIAIRRGPMKVPTSGTSVFNISSRQATAPGFVSGFPVDMYFYRRSDAVVNTLLGDRLRGANVVYTNLTDAEAAAANVKFDYMNGADSNSGAFATLYGWMFRRAPSFLDEVCYTGTGANQTLSHNLQAVPELIIVKNRSGVRDWGTGWASIGWGGRGPALNSNETSFASTPTWWNTTAPTASVFTVGSSATTNGSGSNFVAYLFATCAGVSKVFSYTGNGSSQTINCGFTGGARFVLIKRTDSTGDWYVWDSARGIVSGNDPHLSLNTTAAEVTTDDTIDTDSTGFVVNQVSATNVNVSSATYIGIAIA